MGEIKLKRCETKRDMRQKEMWGKKTNMAERVMAQIKIYEELTARLMETTIKI